MPRDVPRSESDDPRRWIPGYRAIVFDREGQGATMVEIDASDDDEALTRARTVAGTLAFELWDALCMICRHEPAT